jgi:hypothetical protein
MQGNSETGKPINGEGGEVKEAGGSVRQDKGKVFLVLN